METKLLSCVLVFCCALCIAQEVGLMPFYHTWLHRKTFDDKNTLLWGAVKQNQSEPLRVSWDLDEDGIYEKGPEMVSTSLPNGHYHFATVHHFPRLRLYRPGVKVEIYRANVWQTLAERKFEVLVCPDSYRPAHIRAAILDGLRYLYKTQTAGGYWTQMHGSENWPQMGTGLMVLAFENEGFFARQSFSEAPFADTVARGMQFLESQCQSVGNGWATQGRYGYSTPINALAFIASRDTRYQNHVQKFVDFLVWFQNVDGGWGYTTSEHSRRSDSSISHWAPTAFIYAREVFGIETPEQVRFRLRAWLLSVFAAGRIKYSKGADISNIEQLGLIGGMLFCLHYINPGFRKEQLDTEMKQMCDKAIDVLIAEWEPLLSSEISYNYYAISRSLKTLTPQINFLKQNDTTAKIKWYPSLADKIVSFNNGASGQLGQKLLGWGHNDDYLTTAFNILTLQPYVLKHRPVADAGEELDIEEGSLFVLDGARSWHSVAGEDIVSYDWDLNGDGKYMELRMEQKRLAQLYIEERERFIFAAVSTADLPQQLDKDQIPPYVGEAFTRNHRPFSGPSYVKSTVIEAGKKWLIYDSAARYPHERETQPRYYILNYQDQGKVLLVHEKIGARDISGRLILSTYFSKPGTYLVNLQVTDHQSRQGEDTIALHIHPKGARKYRPIAHFAEAPYCGKAHANIEVSIGNSMVPAANQKIDPRKTAWDVDGDGQFSERTGQQSAIVKEEHATLRWVGVRLYSNVGEVDQSYTLVKVLPNAPHRLQWVVGEMLEGENELRLKISDEETDQQYKVTWQLCDATDAVISTDTGYNYHLGEHLQKIVFPDNGAYLLKAVVEDDVGLVIEAICQVQVANIAPRIEVHEKTIDGNWSKVRVEIQDGPEDCRRGFQIDWQYPEGCQVLLQPDIFAREVRFGGQRWLRIVVTDKDGGKSELSLDLSR